ncbi:LOW QUALITY PROTEIN: uncharacterized protein LOC134832348 [Culicoides brevitarsis]|uniref:LOW QUALITY PROTEIN: uncharacterized protein LOC134832348 n=1 Tax=Culicoides brevitarsis TaxID=469753 RepID=UPI00307BB62A
MEGTAEAPDQPKEKSQSDILAARREARRRRILENSNNRLSKITGREHNEPPLVAEQPISTNVIYPDPEMERDTFEPTEQPPEDVLEMLRELRSQAGFNPSSLGSDEQPIPKEPPSKFAKFLQSKVHYMLMGVIVSLLFATHNEWLVGNNVFLPLFCWEAIEVFVLKTYVSKLNFLGIIFVFLGVDQRQVQIITKLLETLNKLFNDFSCFLFFFVVTHVAFGYFWQQKDFNDVLFPAGEVCLNSN